MSSPCRALPFPLVLVLVWAGCGGASRPGEGPPAMAPTSLEAALAELDAAEARIGGVAPEGKPTAARPADPATPPPAEPPHSPSSSSGGDPGAASSGCENACDALASMRRAVDHVCSLSPGERCEGAKSRLTRATERVHATCSVCEESP